MSETQMTPEELRRLYSMKWLRDARSDNIREVTEGPIVGQLAYVFRQIEEAGLGRGGK